MSTIVWTGRVWNVIKAGGGLDLGDSLKFENLKIMVSKKGNPYEDWATYPALLTAYQTSCNAEVGTTTHNIQYCDNDPKKDLLIGATGSDSLGSGDSGSLSWMLGGIAGLMAGLCTGFLLEASPYESSAIAFAATAVALGSKFVTDHLLMATSDPHGPGGSSWIAEEGGVP